MTMSSIPRPRFPLQVTYYQMIRRLSILIVNYVSPTEAELRSKYLENIGTAIAAASAQAYTIDVDGIDQIIAPITLSGKVRRKTNFSNDFSNSYMHTFF